MNKLSKLILMLPLALAPLAGQAAPKGGSHAALAAGFVAPPDSVQTSVYWYWLSGNVSKEGVVKIQLFSPVFPLTESIAKAFCWLFL